MIRTLTLIPQDDDIHYVEMAGLSTDDKPTKTYATGSSFLEVDTGDVYFFDEESGTWINPDAEGDGNE